MLAPVDFARVPSRGSNDLPGKHVLWRAFVDSELRAAVMQHERELVAFRRRLHQHPELAFAEHQTTSAIFSRLEQAGFSPRILPTGTGVICDLGVDGLTPEEPIQSYIALRADIDALPIADRTDLSYRSLVDGVSHSCGHDVHTSVLLGAALVLKELALRVGLPQPVRFIFQPAEEIGKGAAVVLDAGGLENARYTYALHCDPSIEVGLIGLRTGPITSSCDFVELEVTPLEGRPQVNLIAAWGGLVGSLAAMVAQRAAHSPVPSLVWGHVSGDSDVAQRVVSRGTVRCLDETTWQEAPDLLRNAVSSFAASHEINAVLSYLHGMPPAVNDADAVDRFRLAAGTIIGPESIRDTEQSLGGEDFALYLRHTPGVLVRLGALPQGATKAGDLHQGDLILDERAIGIGVQLLVASALLS